MDGENVINLDQTLLTVSRVTYRRVMVELNTDVWLWLSEHKIKYQFRATSRTTALIQIPDSKKAMLFKLTWM